MNNYIIKNDEKNLQPNTINADSAMKAIAEGKNLENETLLQYTDINSNKQQFQMFIVAQAKRELHRVLKLSELLNKVEDQYEQRITQQLDVLPTEAIADVMTTIMACIDRSNSIISKTIKDKDLLQLLIIDNSTNVNVNEVSEDSIPSESNPLKNMGLDTASSRRRVIDAVKVALSVLDKQDVIEVDSTNE